MEVEGKAVTTAETAMKCEIKGKTKVNKKVT